MSNQLRVLDDDPLMIAWKSYRATPDFDNTKQWAGKTVIVTSEGLSPISVSHPHLLGSLWAAFEAGFRAAANVRRQDEDDRAESAGDPL
jgi:hypothetical protein